MKKKGVIILSIVVLVAVGLIGVIYAIKPDTVIFTKNGIKNEKAWNKFIAETEDGKARKINIVFEANDGDRATLAFDGDRYTYSSDGDEMVGEHLLDLKGRVSGSEIDRRYIALADDYYKFEQIANLEISSNTEDIMPHKKIYSFVEN